MKKKWNVCMVGMGYWSDVHFRAWASVPQVQISALVDRNPPKLASKSERWNVPQDRLFLTLEEALKIPEIDIVDVITRPDSHLEMTERAARAGKHVLCQKPFAPTLDECKQMVKICNQHGVRLMIAEGWRWQSHFMAIKQLLDSSRLGELVYAKISAKWNFTPRFQDRASMTQPYFKDMDRLLLYEMGPHWIDTYKFLFGMPQGITAVTKRISPYIVGDDLGILVFHHEKMTGMLECSWASLEYADSPYTQPGGENLMEYVWIEGTLAGLRLKIDGSIELVHRDGSIEKVPYNIDPFQESHNRLHQHFISHLETNEPFVTSGEEYLKVMEVIEAAYQTGGNIHPLSSKD